MKRSSAEEALLRCWKGLPPSGRVVLAVSGGVDSMVLLEAAVRAASKNFENQRLLVAHVNHGLRGAESDADEAFVRAEAAKRGLECRVDRLTWGREAASQAACRRRREAFFASLLADPADRILYAHHRDDQAETVLFRLIRGTGAKGLRGMREQSGRKLRPFLGIPKAELARAAAAWSLAWREDSSNRSAKYDRNWIRLELLPQIEERRPGFAARLANLAEEAQGWKLPRGGLEVFSYTPEASFARVAGKVRSAELSATFGLGRKHARSLLELLSRPSGQLHAEGVRFTWSAGLLLAERGAGFRPGTKPRGNKFTSCLGEWGLAGSAPAEPRSGEKVKKEFQRHRVPVFFRGSIPLVREGGKPRALLPRPGACKPSPLARWWLQAQLEASRPTP